MLEFILLCLGFAITVVSLLWLYYKLTPKNVPNNLGGYFSRAIWFILITVALIYGIIGAFLLFF